MEAKSRAADRAFSECVRERANWRCEKCGQQFSESARGSLQCAHIRGRREKSIRYDPLNALALCFSCHQHLDRNPEIKERFVTIYLGKDNLKLLDEKRNTLIKHNKEFIKKCASHYRKQFKVMREYRKQGYTGRIEFEEFEGLL